MRTGIGLLINCAAFFLATAAKSGTITLPLPPLITANEDLRGYAQPVEVMSELTPSGRFIPLEDSTLSFYGKFNWSAGDADPLEQTIAYEADASLRTGEFRLGSYSQTLYPEELLIPATLIYFSASSFDGLVDPLIAMRLQLYDFPSVYAPSIAEALTLGGVPLTEGDEYDYIEYVNAVVWAKVDGTLPIITEVYSCADNPSYIDCDYPHTFIEGSFDVSEIGFYLTGFAGQDTVDYVNPLFPFLSEIEVGGELQDELAEVFRENLFSNSLDVSTLDFPAMQREVQRVTGALSDPNVITGVRLAPVPLPASWALLGVGMFGMAWLGRVRRCGANSV